MISQSADRDQEADVQPPVDAIVSCVFLFRWLAFVIIDETVPNCFVCVFIFIIIIDDNNNTVLKCWKFLDAAWMTE